MTQSRDKKSRRSSEELTMRGIVDRWLRELWPSARIIHELPLRYSSNVIDVAAVTKTTIHAVEIKSSRDTLDRLEAQVRSFSPIATRLSVALAPCWNIELPMKVIDNPRGGRTFIPRLTEAQVILARNSASHIGTWTCCAVTDSIQKTDGGWNDNIHPDTFRLLHMLRVEELVRIADKNGLPTHDAVHRRLVAACWDAMTGRQIVRAVCAALRARDAFCDGTDPPIVEDKVAQ
jgi:hypothetical protein